MNPEAFALARRRHDEGLANQEKQAKLKAYTAKVYQRVTRIHDLLSEQERVNFTAHNSAANSSASLCFSFAKLEDQPSRKPKVKIGIYVSENQDESATRVWVATLNYFDESSITLESVDPHGAVACPKLVDCFMEIGGAVVAKDDLTEEQTIAVNAIIEPQDFLEDLDT